MVQFISKQPGLNMAGIQFQHLLQVLPSLVDLPYAYACQGHQIEATDPIHAGIARIESQEVGQEDCKATRSHMVVQVLLACGEVATSKQKSAAGVADARIARVTLEPLQVVGVRPVSGIAVMFQTQTGQQQFLVGGEMLRPIGALPLVRDGSIVCNELDTCVFLNPSSVGFSINCGFLSGFPTPLVEIVSSVTFTVTPMVISPLSAQQNYIYICSQSIVGISPQNCTNCLKILTSCY